ncbi:MAG: type I DNA topoisomerase [Calditrichia bacterium]
MSKNHKLVIVESPAKAKTIHKILGKEYEVAASVGHIIDLPKSQFGVDIENGFKPQFVTIKGKNKIIKQLRDQAKTAEEIILATDPDREGEAIAFHIAKSLESINKNISRIEFQEITRNAVLRALEHRREIDMARVNAQQARRVMDRIVGYQVSPILWETIFKGLSAGRVQSVALRLICEREEEIDKFIPIEYWTVEAFLERPEKEVFRSKLVSIDGKTLDPQKFRIANKQEAEAHRQSLFEETYRVSEIEKKTLTKKPPPPFITSTLQQEASRKLRMTTTRIMSIAQQLYEGINLGNKGNVGLITYMRTDSTRISSEAINKVRPYIAQLYGPTYLPAKPNVFAKGKSAQDAHEAIRPTYLESEYEPKQIKKFLTSDQYKLYELIWRRFLACQMKPAKIDKTIVHIKAGRYGFRTEGEVITFRGFLVAYENGEEEAENGRSEPKQDNRIPPSLAVDQILKLEDLKIEQKFTQPPPRYTESTLVKMLEKLGIGRPSTYAQIISTILTRKYIERNERSLVPTELGKTVNRLLVHHFPDIFNIRFTAKMELSLDKIEQKQAEYVDTLDKFYRPFHASLEKVREKKKEIKKELQEETELKCEICGRVMVVKWGRNGRFYACSGFPECKNTKPIEEQVERESEEICERCGSPMRIKRGRFGEFLACSNYPTCKNTRPISTGVHCPLEGCDGTLVQRQSKKGKVFYSCSRYPDCKYALWDKPVNQSCPQCGFSIMVEKTNRVQGYFLLCPSCKFKKVEDELN